MFLESSGIKKSIVGTSCIIILDVTAMDGVCLPIVVFVIFQKDMRGRMLMEVWVV